MRTLCSAVICLRPPKPSASSGHNQHGALSCFFVLAPCVTQPDARPTVHGLRSFPTHSGERVTGRMNAYTNRFRVFQGPRWYPFKTRRRSWRGCSSAISWAKGRRFRCRFVVLGGLSARPRALIWLTRSRRLVIGWLGVTVTGNFVR